MYGKYGVFYYYKKWYKNSTKNKNGRWVGSTARNSQKSVPCTMWEGRLKKNQGEKKEKKRKNETM